jgi:hypothetical protein
MAPIKERDLRANIKEMGTEEGIIYTLERMIGEHMSDRHHVRELTKLVDQAIDQLSIMMRVSEHMKQTIVSLKRVQAQGDDLDHSS